MTEMSEGRQLRDLLAREAVRDLRAQYAWHAARGDYEKIVDLFAPDGLFEVFMEGARHQMHGRDEIRAMLARTMVPGMVFPMIHNDLVIVSGDEAHGTCAMQSRRPDGGTAFSGYYHDKARRIDGGWLFTERRYFFYSPTFERSGFGIDGEPETGLAAEHG